MKYLLFFLLPFLCSSQELSVEGQTSGLNSGSSTVNVGTGVSLTTVVPSDELYDIANCLSRENEADATLGIDDTFGVTLASIESSPSPENGTSLLEISSTDQNSDRAQISLVLEVGNTYDIKYYAWEASGGDGRSTVWTGFSNFVAVNYNETPTEYTHTLTVDDPAQLLRFYNFGVPKVYVDGLSIKEVTPDPAGDFELATLKAFPSAMGYPATTITGGRDGKIFYVNTLTNTETGSYDAGTDTHTGSLKYALEHPDPGYVVFEVSGVIEATSTADFNITGENDKTIMGATAPYPGIVIWGDAITQGVGTENIIWRGITFLLGSGSTPGSQDAFNSNGAVNFIVSDCTVGWGSDENLSCTDAGGVIIQNTMFLEGYDGHNKGSIMGSDVGFVVGQFMSYHNNGFAHIDNRSPNWRLDEDDRGEDFNNNTYNWNQRMKDDKHEMPLNHENNYFKKGPKTAGSSTFWKWNADMEANPDWDPPNDAIYTAGNIITGVLTSPTANNRVHWNQHITANGFTANDPLPESFFRDTPWTRGTDVKMRSAADSWAYNIEGKNIGARYYMDASGIRQKYIHPFVDAYMDDMINGTALAYRNSTGAAYTKPTLPTSGSPCADTDRDGMCDEWETANGLNVGVDDQFSVKATWTLDGATWDNTANYKNIDVYNDYIHGGFIRERDINNY